MGFKPLKDAHGKIIGVEFSPTPKMLRYVIAVNKAENISKSNLEICKELGISEPEFSRWHNDFVIHEFDKDGNVKASKNHFQDWFDEVLEIRSGEEREMLRAVGMKKALEGEYNYWRDMSKTYGAISNDIVEHKHTTIPFSLKENATLDDIKHAKAKLLAQQRSLGDAGGSGMVRLTGKRSKG